MNNNIKHQSAFLPSNQDINQEAFRPQEIDRSNTPPPKLSKQQVSTTITPERKLDLMKCTPRSVRLLINTKDHNDNSLDEVLRLVIALNDNASSSALKAEECQSYCYWEDKPIKNAFEQSQGENIERLNDAIERLINNGKPKPLLMTLKFLSDYPFGRVNEFFTKTLRALQQKIPGIVGANHIREDEQNPTLGQIVTPESVQKLFTFFEGHFNIPVGLLTCQKSTDLLGLVDRMVTEMKEGEFKGWAISNGVSDMDLHMVPVFAIVQKGKVNIYIFDSVGHHFDGRNNTGLDSMSHCFQVLLMRGSNLHSGWKNKVAIYSYAEQRQHDVRGCWAFVVQDLRDLAEMHLDNHAHSIVDFYSDEEQPTGRQNAGDGEMKFDSTPDSPALRNNISRHFHAGKLIELYEVKSLPPAMMKVTQSLKKINQYCEQSKILGSENAFRPHSATRPSPDGGMVTALQNLSDLKATVSQNTIRNSKGNKVQNVYAGKMRFTYIVYLITSLWEEQRYLQPKTGSIKENFYQT